MEEISITAELLKKFRQKAQTLIMEGYCVNVKGTRVFCSGEDYATVSRGSDNVVKICIDTQNAVFVDELLENFGLEVEFCGVSSYVTEYLKSKYDFAWETDCDLYAYDGGDLPALSGALPPIDAKYAELISDGTPYHADIAEIEESLRIHPSSAVYVDGKPVCWCLLHVEGSLGMLYTLPQFRRQGYALKVMTDLTRKVLALGNVPFAYIICDNAASKALAPKYRLQPVCKANYFEIAAVKK